MSVYTTLMNAYAVNIKIRIAPRVPNKVGTNPMSEDMIPLVSRYTSKSNNQKHLIFNPKVAMIIDSTNRMQTSQVYRSVMIPMHMIYQFASVMDMVYQYLSTDKWYYKDNGDYHIATEEVKKYTKRFSVAREFIYMYPTIIHIPERDDMFGIMLSTSSSGEIGALTHVEAQALLRLIDALDIATYSMLAATMERMLTLEDRIDTMNTKLDTVLSILQRDRMGDTTICQQPMRPAISEYPYTEPLQLPMK